MDAYCAEVRKLEKNFEGLEILHIVRDLNVVVDVLVKLRSNRAQVPPGVFVEELTSPSIKQPPVTSDALALSVQVLTIVPSWIEVFIDYIKEHKLSADKGEAAQIVRRSKNYVYRDNFFMGRREYILLWLTFTVLPSSRKNTILTP
jgi:hypothetical protein